jgi:formylglycine-generating enzyme required for sulfatase activity
VVASLPGASGKVIQVAEGRRQRWGWIAAAIAAAVLMLAYIGSHFAASRGPPAPTSDRIASQTAMEEQSRTDQAADAEAEAKLRAANETAKVKSDRGQAEAETERRADEEAAQREPALSVTPGSGQSFIDRLFGVLPCPQCPEMVVAPAGTFTMGSPATEKGRGTGEAQIPVTIARPFAVGKFAVTFSQWDACVADAGCTYRPNDQGWGRGNRPVINVNWADANTYAKWLSRNTGKAYRLLSEAEREYVTRAGTTTPYWWGSSITPKQANYNGNQTYGGGPKGEFRKRTVPVDTFEPNPWGLFNVHGNVYEWTADCWNDSNQGNPADGSARTTGDCVRRVVRGSSWGIVPLYLRAAFRAWGPANSRSNDVGLRLARTLDP